LTSSQPRGHETLNPKPFNSNPYTFERRRVRELDRDIAVTKSNIEGMGMIDSSQRRSIAENLALFTKADQVTSYLALETLNPKR